ncbi:MAG: tRNA lysidine(34) synthetase TilS [Deltaproteobacteria bacterium GWB2_55_19]|nr:MAG: tRNA lysidine(34) synthetase TilS [Deltaproteobacteria bacterium GWB2_55_19]HAO93853.1 tRNA lysidine(34) synthetase TilS [Deltaproteobacteria bacterium]
MESIESGLFLKKGLFALLLLSMIEKTFRNTIKRLGLLRKGDAVLAAVSGGADSIVMLRLLSTVKDELGLKLSVCHLNHNMRGAESMRDLEFVKKTARGLGLKFIGKTLGKGALVLKGKSLQEAAREERYAFFEDAAKKTGADRIALGHTLDDQAETVLLRLLKGASLSGLSGIPPVRAPFIRPLIEVKREEIERYAADEGIDFVIDSTNNTPKYLRNSVRLALIPFLEKNYNCSVKETLARTARVLAFDDAFIDGAADEAFPALIERGKGYLALDRLKILSLHRAVSSRVFLKALGSFDPASASDLSSAHVEAFHAIVDGRSPSASIKLPCGIVLRREYDRVIIARGTPVKRKPFEKILKVPGRTVIPGCGAFVAEVSNKRPKSIVTGVDTIYLDLDEAGDGLFLRPFIPGDRIVPFGMTGHKKIKDILIDAKAPRHTRQSIPLLLRGGDVIWVAGVKRSDLFRVTGKTARVLKVEWVGRGG